MIAPPRKTELGQEELRKRTRKLSQRHRTVLLLVDGKRSRTEVLTLAQQAGSAPSLFDELLAMGMVEEPSVPTVPAPLAEAQTVQTAAEPRPEPQAAPQPEAQLEAQVDSPPAPQLQPVEAAADGAPAAVEAERVEIEIAPPVTDAAAEPPAVPSADDAPAQPAPADPPLVTEPVTAVPFVDRRVADQPVPVERRAARAKVTFAPPSDEPPPVRNSGPAPLVGPAESLAAELPELAPTTPLDPEQRLLTEVRGLLVGTLLIDGPVSSSLLALRVGRAKTRDELIGLVWEIEHSLARSRRPREARGRLERARDLLGLGNTLVDEDTSFGRDSQW